MTCVIFHCLDHSATKIFNEIWLDQALELKERAGECFLFPPRSQAFL